MMTTTPRFSGRVLLLLGLLLDPASVSGQTLLLADPVQSFLDGFNPTDEDFFARSPQETALLRMRPDIDGDSHRDLVLSESSVFGNGGGPWLVFRRLHASRYRYVGEIFAAPGDLHLYQSDAGTVLVAGFGLSADLTHLARYRVTADTIVQLSEQDTSGGSGATRGAELESCRLPDYKRDAVHCWHPGWTAK